jgi:hypothetical protein
LAIREKVLAANHPDVAETLSNLAVVYENLVVGVESGSLEREP